MSNVKRAEKASRRLTEREVSDLRYLRAVGTSRELLARVERIISDRRLAAQ